MRKGVLPPQAGCERTARHNHTLHSLRDAPRPSSGLPIDLDGRCEADGVLKEPAICSFLVEHCASGHEKMRASRESESGCEQKLVARREAQGEEEEGRGGEEEEEGEEEEGRDGEEEEEYVKRRAKRKEEGSKSKDKAHKIIQPLTGVWEQ